MTGTGASEDDEARTSREHLRKIEDGCGCAEVWERLSEQRASE